MNRQEAKIKLLARSLAVLFLAFLTTAESCEDANVVKFFQTVSPVEETRIAGQTKTRAAEQTKEALLALLPASPSSGQVTTIPLPTHTATPTPTSPNTPTPTSTITRTPTPTSTPTLPPTATHTPTPATMIYQDLLDDCSEYTGGKSVPCPKGYDIRQVEISVVNNVLMLRVVLSDIFTGALAIRYTTPPGVGTQVQGVATYQDVENGNWLAWQFGANSCKREAGPVNPQNSSCQVADKETRVTVPVPELGQATVPIDFRVFVINFADQNPNTPADLAPNLPDKFQITLQRPDSAFHPIFNPWQVVAK